MLIGIMVAFFFTPYLISNLGDNGYGVYILGISFLGFLSVFELGLGDSAVRFIIKNEKSEKKGHLFFNLFALYALLSLALILLSCMAYDHLEFVFSSGFDEGEIKQFKKMFVLVVISCVLTLLLSPFSSYLYAKEKFVFVRCVEIIAMLLTVGLIVISFSYNVSPYNAFFATFIVLLLGVIAKLIYSLAYLKLPIEWTFIDRELIMSISLYALPIFVVVISELIYWKLDNIIIAYTLAPNFIAIYAIGLMFHKYFMAFATSISRLMTPSLIASIDDNSPIDKIVADISNIARIQVFVVFYILFGIILVGKDFINIWIGENYTSAYYIMLLIMVPFSFELIGNLRNTLLQVKGLYWYRATIVLIASFVNVLLTFQLIDSLDILGVALATSISLVLSYVATHVMLYIKVGFNLKLFYKTTFAGYSVIFLLCLTLYIVFHCLFLPATWWAILVKVLVFTFLYLISCWFFSFDSQLKYKVKNKFLN